MRSSRRSFSVHHRRTPQACGLRPRPAAASPCPRRLGCAGGESPFPGSTSQESNRHGIPGIARADGLSELLLNRPDLGVPPHLRQDRGCAHDGEELVRVVLGDDLHVVGNVPLNRALEIDLVHVHGVDVGDCRVQTLDDRREHPCLEIVEGHLPPHGVDVLGRDNDDLVLCDLLNFRSEPAAPLRGELLRVPHVQRTKGDVRIHRDARDHEGSEDGPSTCFIDAANHAHTSRSSRAVSWARATTAASSTDRTT